MALELTSLPERHRCVAFLGAYATSAYVRLTIDPRPYPLDPAHRGVSVNWLARPGDPPAQDTSRDIGWANLPPHILADAVLWTATKQDRTINEEGAIGVIALLLHDLEKVSIERVVPIGLGGDYFLVLEDGQRTQVECTGVYIDERGYEAWSRLGKKAKQVLSHSENGFASVVTFCNNPTEEAHCYLHFVKKVPVAETDGKKPKKRRRRQ